MGFLKTEKTALPRNIGPIMERSVEDKKGWFVLVRRIRGNMGDNITQDKFSNPKKQIEGVGCWIVRI